MQARLISSLLVMCIVLGIRFDARARVVSLLDDASQERTASPLASPFRKTREYLTDAALPLPATVGSGGVFLALAGGRVISMDRKDGSLLWSSEPGGTITVPLLLTGRGLLVATGSSGGGGVLRLLDQTTGLTLWSRQYAAAFAGPLVDDGGRIYAGSIDGSLMSLSSQDGELIWRFPTQGVVRSRPLISGDALFFGSDDGAFRSLESQTGKEKWRVQTGAGISGSADTDGRTVYFGSGDGYVRAIDISSGKLKWNARTGASISSAPVIADDLLILGSLDNFVYALSRSHGDRLWKMRMDNRLICDPIVHGACTMIAPFRSNQITVLMNADGRRANSFKLDRGYEIVASPIYSEGDLFIATDKGLVTATSRPADQL